MTQFFESGRIKYWSFSFSISRSNDYSGLISFRMDWLDFLAVQGSLKSLFLWKKAHGFQYIDFCLSVQFSSVAQLCPTLCDPMDCSMPGFPVVTNSRCLLKFTSIELVMPSNHLIFCCSLLLPSVFPSIRVFSNELALHIRWPKY